MATQGKQLSFIENAKTMDFKFPDTELYKYTEVKQVKPMVKNVYEGYTNEFLPLETRKSTSERLFERFCEKADSVEWVYKNGDSGQQYLSIVYVNGIRKQWLFYPDYIIKTKDGNVWIIETKGGMQAGHTKNIDRQVENKFNAFKAYAERYNLHWGFVRDIDEELYINNTVYTEDDNHNFIYSIRSLTVRAIYLTTTHEPVQLSLDYDMKKAERNEKIEKAMKNIRKRYGSRAITFGSLLHIEQEFLPGSYNNGLTMPSGIQR